MANFYPILRKTETRTIKKERQVIIEKFWLNLVGGKARARTLKLWRNIQPYRYFSTCPEEFPPYHENIVSKQDVQSNRSLLSFGAFENPTYEARRQKNTQEIREFLTNKDHTKVRKEELPILTKAYIQYMWDQQEYVDLDENKSYYNYGIVLSKYDAAELFNLMSNFIPDRFMPYVMLFPTDDNIVDFKKVLSLIHELDKSTPSKEYELCSIRVKFTFDTNDTKINNANIQNRYSSLMAPFVIRITVEDQAARCTDYFESYIVLPTEISNSTSLADTEITQKYFTALERIEDKCYILKQSSPIVVASTFGLHHIWCIPRELIQDTHGRLAGIRHNIYSNTDLSKFINKRGAILEEINSLL